MLLYVVVAWLPHGQCICADALTARDAIRTVYCTSFVACGLADKTPWLQLLKSPYAGHRCRCCEWRPLARRNRQPKSQVEHGKHVQRQTSMVTPQ